MLKYVIGLFFILQIFLAALGQIPAIKQCFETKPHHGISNLRPIDELWHVGVDECLHHCIYKTHRICAAVVYHKNFYSCQIYDQSGEFHDADVVAAAGHDYFIRTNFTGNCRVHKNAKGKINTAIPIRQRGVPNYANAVEVEPLKIDPKIGQRTDIKEKPLQMFYTSSYLVPNTPVDECPHDQKLAFLAFNDWKFVSNSLLASFSDVPDLNACLNHCVQNKNESNENIPCILASYESTLQLCQLHGEDAKESIVFSRIQRNSGSVFIEKFCIPYNSRCEFGSKFNVQVEGRSRPGGLRQYIGIETLSECANLCVNHRWCKKLSYYQQECTLHATNVIEDRNQRLDDEQVAFIEINCSL
ncbi:hypothetical protein Ddc_00848 [Ditylenchus destructor]|nr:hypothetical protein Ddc_00848 [Ditylenchus destructor]